jgi:hypothetical protein
MQRAGHDKLLARVLIRQRAGADVNRWASDCSGHTTVIPLRHENRHLRSRRRI